MVVVTLVAMVVMVAVVHRSKYIGWRVGLVAVSSALYLSRVPARSFTPEVRL